MRRENSPRLPTRYLPLTKTAAREAVTAYVLISPFFIFFLSLIAGPFVFGVWMSLHNWNLLNTDQVFVGADNYVRAMTDKEFWITLGHTVYFLVLSTVPLIATGLGLAMLVNRKGLTGRIMRTSVYLPTVLSVSVASAIWIQIYDGQRGLITQGLEAIGLHTDKSLLDNTALAMPAIVAMTLWWTVGTNMLFFIAGLQDIPLEVLEAARLDGASSAQQFRHIIVPGLRRTFAFVIVTQIVASLQVFGQVDILTGGGPLESTRVLMQYIVDTSFRDFDLGYGNAMGILLFLVIAGAALTQFALTRKGMSK